jgi:thymidylate kinase
VYVDAPLQVRLERIGGRVRDLAEDRANHVSGDDLRVLQARDDVARQLIADEPDRFLVVDNSSRPVNALAAELADLIVARTPPVR